MATRMQQRRGTAAEWTSANPVLGAGEIGFETDTNKFKIGDDSTTWSSLPYFTTLDEIVDGAPGLLDTLNELAAAIGDDDNFINNVATKAEVAALQVEDLADVSVTSMPELGMALLYDDTDDLWKPAFVLVPPGSVVSSTPPQEAATGGPLASGETWFDSKDGRLYVYILEADADGFWVEVGGTEENQDTSEVMNFPTSPSTGDSYLGYTYDTAKNAWKHSPNLLGKASDVDITDVANENILMYNSSTDQWENVPGVKLDESSLIPLSFLTNALDAIVNGNAEDNLTAFKEYVNAQDSALDSAISDVLGTPTTEFNSLSKIENYINENLALAADVAPLNVKTTAGWASDSSIPAQGSVNVELGTEVRLKIGDGTNTFANLAYVPSPTSVGIQISEGITGKANLESPVFSGNVSLPATTTIGDIDGTEISYLDGVTSGIQGQLNSLDSLKAPLADPTFTGTVSGITKSMVGLSNVDNTADTDKPVSTAQQTALDAKLNLAGGTMTGKITLDGDPTQALHAVTKQYVDNVEAGLITRPAVKAATTANLAGTYNNGTAGVGATLNLGQLADLNIDGVDEWSQWNGILVKNQTNAFENGRYVVFQLGNDTDTDWILRRCPLCDEADEIPGSYIFVTDGATNEQTGWVQHVADPATFTVGTDSISVYQFAGSGAVTAGTNVSVSGNQVSVLDAPVFTGIVDASAAGVEFSDGVQTQAGVPSLTTFVEKTANYQLDTLNHKDNVVEMNMSTAGTFTVPLDATLAWPVGASVDIFATGTGAITIAAEAGVTLNATPGLTLRTRWSSATILKRGANNWVVYGDLKA
jgi:hypothetical protein